MCDFNIGVKPPGMITKRPAAMPWGSRWRREALLHENLRVGRFGPLLSSPQEPHYRNEVEGPSHVQDEVPRGELAGL